MDYQFLQEGAPPEGPRLGPTEAQVLSFALHLLLLFLVLYVPSHLPPRLRAWLEPQPITVAIAPAPEPPLVQPSPARPRLRQPPPQKIPLGFAYVKVPNDTPAARKDPNAPLLSDKNRQARQEMPTPPDAKRRSIDPHSEGNTETRVRPDPSLPEGPESPQPPQPSARDGAESGGSEGQSMRDEEMRQASGESGAAGGGAAGAPGLEGSVPPGAGGSQGPGTGHPAGGYIASAEARARVQQILSDAHSSEHKDTFVNPGYLSTGNYGMMSFDTQDFPWGDYQRKVYMAIRNNWFARIPLAARQGMRGYVCWHFVIEKDGTVSSLQSIRPSSVPPLDRAADDAIRASSRLPPLPEGFPNPQEGTTFCFFYNMLPSEAE